MNQLPILTLTGSPRERGYQHGKALKDGIHRFYETWIKRFENESPLRLTETDLLAFTGKHGPYARQFAPDIYEEMEGIAEGAELTFEKVLFINCFDELGSVRSPEIAAKLTGQPLPPPVLPLQGCTSFAAFGEATVDGRVYIGQGYDSGTRYYEPVVFRIEAWGDEPEQLVFSHAGGTRCLRA